MTHTRKKLIEVALPLEAINKASAREKSIRHGHPSTLHLWWARRPLAAARAVIFAQMVDDPSAHPERFPTEAAQVAERERLFKLIEELVKWENTTNETLLAQARAEIRRSWRLTCEDNRDHPRAAELFDPEKLPAFHDPFAGGGALPLEAQRLGLESYASDLNPVAVLINKAMIEIPPKFAGQPPVNPASRGRLGDGGSWRGAAGLAEDVRYYGQWMRGEAEQRIGHLYPKIKITREMVDDPQNPRPDLKKYLGQELTVIAWLWARTVRSPNPAFAEVAVPLASTFMLSTKVGKEAYVEPVVEGGSYRFTVKVGKPGDVDAVKMGTKLSRGANFRCLMSEAPIAGDYIKAEGKAGRMGARMMAIVAEGERGRVYLAPTGVMEAIAGEADPDWRPETSLPDDARNFWTLNYGLTVFGDLFTPRQLVALNTFSDLIQEARERVRGDAVEAGMGEAGMGEAEAGEYGDAVGVYLSFILEKLSEAHTTICTWSSAPKNELVVSTFRRQALPMTWDFAEANPFADSSGSFLKTTDAVSRVISMALSGATNSGADQANAAQQHISQQKVVSTDPPYYDNIGYADLSDFFYVWMRRSLRPTYPELFATLAVPKNEELVATPYRHGSKELAEVFFLDGMTQAMNRLADQAHAGFPTTIYYAFKQAETDGTDGTASTGWETFLAALIHSGFSVNGTWPIRTEREGRSIGIGTNALASSIVLVCRQRPANAPTISRREFLTTLKAELPQALIDLQRGNIAPVDLAQASIGPGMAVYTRYARVLDAQGNPLTVREALTLINQTLDEVLAEQEGDFDADTRWALAWFEQSGFTEGAFGVADVLARAKNTSVSGLVDAGILHSKGGKVRLLKPTELPANWDPAEEKRLTIWEITHQLIRVLEVNGEAATASLLARIGDKAEISRELAYRLYTLCERKKRAAEALSYNGLVQSWPEIDRLSREIPSDDTDPQADLDF